MSQDVTTGEVIHGTELYGLLAEFPSAEALLKAARQVRDAGYRRWDAFSPYPVHGLDQAMAIRSTRLPWLVLVGGLSGLTGGILLCWWTNASNVPVISAIHGYRLLISGKPIFSLAANIPVIFEMTILFSAFAAVFGMLLSNGLPRLHHPLFASPRFRRVTRDRFFIVIEIGDPAFDAIRTVELLRPWASTVEEIRD